MSTSAQELTFPDFYEGISTPMSAREEDGPFRYKTGPAVEDNSRSSSKFLQTAAVLCGSVVFGSGGVAVATDYSPTSNMYIARALPSRSALGVERTVSVYERMTQIRHYLSLNVSNLAKVFLVQRPTVYAWLKGTSDPHEENLTRLSEIHRIAKEWHRIAGIPMGNLHKMPLANGSSLLDTLCHAKIDTSAVDRILQSLKAEQDRESTAKANRYRSVKSIAEKHGFSPMPSELAKRSVEMATRSVQLQDDE